MEDRFERMETTNADRFERMQDRFERMEIANADRFERMERSSADRFERMERSNSGQFERLEAKMDSHLKWVIGIMATLWSTTMLGVIATLLTILIRQ
jgi:hypothetical protein